MITKLTRSAAKSVKYRQLARCSALCLALSGCSAGIDQAAPFESLGSASQAVWGPLPSGWELHKIGNVTATPDALYEPDFSGMALIGGGKGLFGNYTAPSTGLDGFSYVSNSLAGDGEISGLLLSMGNSAHSEMAFMIRSQMNEVSSYAALGAHVDNGTSGFHSAYRLNNNGASLKRAASLGSWYKLVRRGNVVTGYDSSNGIVWRPLNPPFSVTLTGIGAAAYYGIDLSSGDPAINQAATYTLVAVGKLPLALLTKDIGAVSPAGNTSATYEDGGELTVQGAGHERHLRRFPILLPHADR